MKSRRLDRYGYGWIPDVPSIRDFKYSTIKPTSVQLPPVVDLRHYCSEIVNQNRLGSCTGNAWAGSLEALMKKNRGHNVPFSRLYIYYNERKLQGTINEDSGATIREGAKTLATQGACFEINWPYVESQFTVEPDFGCYVQGKQFKTTSYHRLDNTKLEELLSCLAEGFTFVFGFTVFDSMESRTVAQTGILSMPNSSDKVLGGHAVVAVGYDLNTRYFLIRNSWGPDWGQKGCVWMPFDYLTNADLADDFWTLRAGLNV